MNRFLTMSCKAAALPLFFLRVINGALIRLIPSIYLLVFYETGATEVIGGGRYMLLLGAVSLVWSFFYAVSTPSVPLLAYMYRSYPQKIRSLLGKRLAFLAAIVVLGIIWFVSVSELPLYAVFYFWYLLISVTVNILLTVMASSIGYQPILEELCYQRGGDCETMTVSEIYHKSGMDACFSKEGLKRAVQDLKSVFHF